MNLRALLLFTGLLYSTLATGQINRYEVGVEGGPSLTYLRGNEFLEELNDPTIGFSGGLTFQYNFPKIVSLRTNVSFERKGAITKSNFTDSNGNPIGEFTIRTNFEYLTLPILARVSFGKKFKFFANLGPYFGFLIKQTFVTEGTEQFPGGTSDNTENDKRFDAGLSGGIGGSATVKGRFIITLEARHNLGLYNVSKVPVVNDGSILTNSTNLLIGIAYGLGAINGDQNNP